MKAFFTLILLILLTLPQPAQSQGVTTDTFSVVLAANYYSNYWTTPENLDPNGYWRGTNYIISGFLYPANYFDLNCPDTKNCGILVDTIYDGNGNITNFLVTPEDTTVVIGDWDCRSLIIEGPSIGAVDGEETMSEIATQTFNFYAHDLSPCPEGCYVLTEGLLDNVDERRRSISAGTKAFKNIKGDLRWIYLPGEDTLPGFGRNATGFPNLAKPEPKSQS